MGDTTWTGGASTDWAADGNWSNGSPGVADTAILNGTGSFQPVIGSYFTVDRVRLNSGTLTIDAGGTLDALSGFEYTGSATPTLINNGILYAAGTFGGNFEQEYNAFLRIGSTIHAADTFTVAGTADIDGETIFEVLSSSSYDRMIVAGNTSFAGDLKLNAVSYSYSANTTWTLIDVGGTLSLGVIDVTFSGGTPTSYFIGKLAGSQDLVLRTFSIGTWGSIDAGGYGTGMAILMNSRDGIGSAYGGLFGDDWGRLVRISTMKGTEHDDSLGAAFDSGTGAGTDFTLWGRGGDDNFYSGGGNDTVDGGTGTDTIYYDLDFADYTITRSHNQFTISDNGAMVDGTDVVGGVEKFLFYDGSGYVEYAASQLPNTIAAAVNDSTGLNGTEDVAYSFAASTLLANDSDGDSDDLEVSWVGNAVGGTVALSGGTITFTPTANFNGNATFSYKANDGVADSAAATVTINFAAVNDAPIAAGDSLTAALNTPVVYTAAQLLGNDSDAEGDTLSIASVTAGTGGTVALNPNGTVTFTPTSGFTGTATFTYAAKDSASSGNSATVSVTVGGTGGGNAPVITSNGGGATAAISIAENSTAVTTVTSTDVENTARVYSVSGADAAKFNINAASGVLAFKAAPDFESPKGTGGSNVYNIVVTASDGSLSDTQAIAVTVTNLKGKTISGNSKANTIDASHPFKGKAPTGEEDKIDGKGGNDKLKAEAGDDRLIGGTGKDTLTGGAGHDKFEFRSKLGSSNVDTITDFKHNTNIMALDDAIFGKVGSSLSKSEFYAHSGATKAHDSSDRIIYDTKSGKLYYDDDGNKAGGHAAIHFATLTTKPTLDHGDFVIV